MNTRMQGVRGNNAEQQRDAVERWAQGIQPIEQSETSITLPGQTKRKRKKEDEVMKKVRACGAQATQDGCLTPHLGTTTSLI